MGNSCCSDNPNNVSALEGRELGKPQMVTNQVSDPILTKEQHAPSIGKDIYEVPLDEMNHQNEIVQNVINKIGGYIADYEISNSTAEQPEIGPYRYPNGATYFGQYKNGKRHGEGKQIWHDGSIYEGQWKDDRTNGKGRLIHAEGDVFEGQWANDKTNGYGKYTHLDGTTYLGEWKDDLQHGVGKEEWADKSNFEGQYVNGVKEGNGIFSWVDGSRYEGNFAHNDLDGIGNFIKIFSFNETKGVISGMMAGNMQVDGGLIKCMIKDISLGILFNEIY